jgi:peptide/nickel transport system permease protein
MPSEELPKLDWSDERSGFDWPSPAVTTFLVGVAAVSSLYLYDYYVAHVYLVGQWKVSPLEWLFLLSLSVFAALVVATARRRRDAARVWRRFRTDTGAVVALFVFTSIVVIGLFGPYVRPVTHNLLYATQPPLFFERSMVAVPSCSGRVVEGQCHGSLRFPLGTDRFGRDVLALTVAGARIATLITFIAALLVVPLATVVGLLAGYRGGWVDKIAVTGIDAQQTVPAIIVYVLIVSLSNRSLALFVVLFGLFSWGSAARLIRSETRQRRELGYVLAARNLGGDTGHLLRRHLLPNVSNAVVTVTAHLVPILVLTEAAIAFLDLTNPDLLSWGRTVVSAQHWWVPLPAVVALVAMAVSCKLVGDGLRDALDPRGER